MSLLHLVGVRGSDCLGKGEVDSMLFFCQDRRFPWGGNIRDENKYFITG